MLTVIREQFDRQRAEILAKLEASPPQKASPVAGRRTKALLDDFIDWSAAVDAFTEAVKPVLLTVVSETGRQVLADLGLDASQFNPFAEAIVRFNDARSTKIAKDVSDETEKQLRATLTEGFSASESTYELRARVESVMGSASTVRADRISRTEVARAQGFADIEAWTQSGVVSGKEWFTAEDEHVCPFCDAMDNKVVGLEENFFDKGDVLTADGKKLDLSYDDVPSCPLHPNCRCTLLPARA